MAKGFPNVASADSADDELLWAELERAGIPKMEGVTEIFRTMSLGSPEVKTITIGELHGWQFHRYWYYWSATGPGIPFEDATKLWNARKDVRVCGHCASPSPEEYNQLISVGSYHVDTPMGLKALADTIKLVAARAAGGSIEVPAASSRIDEMLLIESVLKGYHPSIARDDALRAIRLLMDTEPGA